MYEVRHQRVIADNTTSLFDSNVLEVQVSVTTFETSDRGIVVEYNLLDPNRLALLCTRVIRLQFFRDLAHFIVDAINDKTPSAGSQNLLDLLSMTVFCK